MSTRTRNHLVNVSLFVDNWWRNQRVRMFVLDCYTKLLMEYSSPVRFWCVRAFVLCIWNICYWQWQVIFDWQISCTNREILTITVVSFDCFILWFNTIDKFLLQKFINCFFFCVFIGFHLSGVVTACRTSSTTPCGLTEATNQRFKVSVSFDR